MGFDGVVGVVEEDATVPEPEGCSGVAGDWWEGDARLDEFTGEQFAGVEWCCLFACVVVFLVDVAADLEFDVVDECAGVAPFVADVDELEADAGDVFSCLIAFDDDGVVADGECVAEGCVWFTELVDTACCCGCACCAECGKEVASLHVGDVIMSAFECCGIRGRIVAVLPRDSKQWCNGLAVCWNACDDVGCASRVCC